MEKIKSYSIIIPHHNLVTLLQRCLNSIPEREDVEVIVVDDNSDEESKRLLRTMQVNQNVRIYFTTEGKGAGYARNIGLKHATGKWLLFCDCDDFFTPNFDKLLDEYIDSDFDLIFWGFETRLSESLRLMPSRVIGYQQALINNDIDYFKFRFHGPWAKMIRKSLVTDNKITFDEVICSNDTFFSGKVGYFSKKSLIDQREIYVTTIREGSLVHNMNLASLSTRISVSKNYNLFLHKKKKDKYRINILSLLFYYNHVDKKAFLSNFINYAKSESLNFIMIDIYKCIINFVKHKIHKNENLRRQIKIKK